jgi:hypothetical protein
MVRAMRSSTHFEVFRKGARLRDVAMLGPRNAGRGAQDPTNGTLLSNQVNAVATSESGRITGLRAVWGGVIRSAPEEPLDVCSAWYG